MPIIKVRKYVKLSENLVELARTYILPETVPCLLDERVPMKYNKRKGAYYTEQFGGVLWYPDDYVRNELHKIEMATTYDKSKNIEDNGGNGSGEEENDLPF